MNKIYKSEAGGGKRGWALGKGEEPGQPKVCDLWE